MATQLDLPFPKNPVKEELMPMTVRQYHGMLEHMVALENTRADLMGVNQELREKINSLEQGQEELLRQVDELKTVRHFVSASVKVNVAPYTGMPGVITEAQCRFPSAETIYLISLGKHLGQIFLKRDEFSLVTKP